MRIVHQETFALAGLAQVKAESNPDQSDEIVKPDSEFAGTLLDLARSWVRYADTHSLKYDSQIGMTPYLAAKWAQVGAGLRGLLVGEVGGFDSGLLAELINNTLLIEGFDPKDF